MNENPCNYNDLMQRVGDMFAEMDSDMMGELMDANVEYASLCSEIVRLTKEFPSLEHILDGNGAISLTVEEHKALSRFTDLTRQREDIERQHLYFRGHTDAFAYLKRIGVI